VLSDGQHNHPNTSLDPIIKERALIAEFNENNKSLGKISVAAVGYFQGTQTDAAEAAGEKVLRMLITNQRAFFKTGDAALIRNFIWLTLS
jgi:hypothetical protein